jgi:hypothetical protein
MCRLVVIFMVPRRPDFACRLHGCRSAAWLDRPGAFAKVARPQKPLSKSPCQTGSFHFSTEAMEPGTVTMVPEYEKKSGKGFPISAKGVARHAGGIRRNHQQY